MKFKKKYAAIAAIIIFVVVNSTATLTLMFGVVYPDRILKEVVTDYFKNNLNKAVKFEDLYIDYDGTIVISDFNVSITSDFNDNISLIKSGKAVINLRFFRLFAGDISVEGIDFYNSEITFIKKYERSHIESFLMLLDPDKFIKKTQKNYDDFYIDFHRAKLFYRESLKSKQITLELYKIDAEMNIDKNNFSYAVSGRIKPYQSDVIRKGDFDCRGAINVRNYESYSHRIVIDNFDLTYFNEHILDYKLSDIALNGGISVDARIIKSKDILILKGQTETNSLTIFSLAKKFNILSNENINLDLDMAVNTALNRYSVKNFRISDDVISLEAAGKYVRNAREEALAIKFKSNSIELGDLSQNLTPLKNIEYSGTLQCEGDISLDFKNKKAPGMKASVVLEGFTLAKNEKGSIVQLIDESGFKLTLDDKLITIDIKGRPLRSDLAVMSRTTVAAWIPFKSETDITLYSKKMNLENLKYTAIYLADRVYASAYEDKRNALENTPFLQRPLGQFMNNNTINMKGDFETVFYGKKSRIRNVSMEAQLNRGAVMVNEFQADGYNAKYRLAFQGYFNSDQPYVKIEGKIDDFDLEGFYSDSGLKGSLTGKARTDFSYEVSAARIGDILDNAKGHLNIYVGKGEMKKTPAQQAIIAFLRKNGFDPNSISDIAFEDVTISISEQGENFWFSNLGIRGDTLLFSAIGDYIYEGGINSTFGITIRKEATVINVPVRLTGPVLAPCIDVPNKKNSYRACF